MTRAASKSLSRRRFLRGALAGGAALALPLPRLSVALADNGEQLADGRPLPRRFGVWFFGNGIDPPSWHPTGTDGVARGDAWSLTEPLAPLQPFKRYLTLLSGLEVRTGDAHVGGTAGAMTAAPPDEFGSAQRPSIDQLVVAAQKSTLPFPSLEVGLTRATPAGPQPMLHAVSHRGPAAPNYPEFDPQRLFARLFGAGATSPELRAAQKSVLDVVLQDFRALRQSVGREDQLRLDAHAEHVRVLERRVEGMEAARCSASPIPGELRADDREEAPADLHDAMSRMLAMALSCDLTQVFSYVFALPAAHVYYRHLGPEFDRSFHEDIVHLIDAFPDGPGLVNKGVRYAMESLAVTLGHFAAVETPTGNLLDELCVLATSEVSYGWTHGMADMPALVIGKGCGALPGDLHVGARREQRNFSDLLLTLAQVMGAELSEIGLGVARSQKTVPEILS